MTKGRAGPYCKHDIVVCHAEKLNQQAITDDLTKLYNRRYLMEALEHMVETYNVNQTSIYIILMDLDDLKKVNDTYGHLRGIRSSAGFRDPAGKTGDQYIAARYGGEEFMLVLPGCSPEAAL